MFTLGLKTREEQDSGELSWHPTCVPWKPLKHIPQSVSKAPATEAAHRMMIPSSCPVPHPCFGQKATSEENQTNKQTKTNHHLQVLHVGDATERLPWDPQDLVFAQISKQEEKRHTALRTWPHFSS